MNQRPILHRGGVPRLPLEHMAKHDPGAAFEREGDRVRREIEEWCREYPFRVRAMPQAARAGHASTEPVSRLGLSVTIAIAAVAAIPWVALAITWVLS